MSGPTDKTYGGLTLAEIKRIWCPNGNQSPPGVICELADEIERLRTSFRAGIEEAAKVADWHAADTYERNVHRHWQSNRIAAAIRAIPTPGDGKEEHE